MVRKRLQFVFCMFLLSLVLLISRYFYWQIIRHDDLVIAAKSQYMTKGVREKPRGIIYTSDGFPLVQNKTLFSLIGDPEILKLPPSDLEKQLQPILGEDFTIDKYPPLSRWLKLTDNINENDKNEISKLDITGLSYEPNSQRYYSEASMAAHLIGFVGNDDSGGKKGFYGLEGFYDREMKNDETYISYQKDAISRPINIYDQSASNPENRNLVLNIDRLLQFQLEKHLNEGIEKYQAKSGFGLIIQPGSGAVLAMAGVPNYDPGRYWLYDADRYRNPVISSGFEPGSIFKVLVMASAIDSGVIDQNTVCERCSGPRIVGEYSIKTWNEKYYPNSTMADVLSHSDNVGMVFVSDKLGLNKFLKYYQALGFEEKTNIDLEGEILPPIRPKQDWGPIDLATASFGQGIAVTPIQFTSAVNVIASGGYYYPPRVVRELAEGQKRIVPEKIVRRQIFQKNTVEVITGLMVDAVKYGEAKWAKPKGYSVAGKTGTAQIPLAGHYDPEKTVASFVGFAPADNPRFTMLVSLVEPKSSPWGSETAAPLWFKIAGDIFRIWGIPPDTN